MADKNRKSQAEKAVDTKNKTKRKAAADNKNSAKNKKTAPQESNRDIPVRLISSVSCLALFILFLVVCLVPEGVFVDLFNSLICGFVGKAAFTVSIPILLYLFLIHAFSGKRPIKMRTICLAGFVFACGCISHLVVDQGALPGGFSLLSELYLGGIAGTTGGLLCGGFAMLMRMLFGTILSYIILVVGSLLMLLGGMQITIPSIIRAIKDRPRANWDADEEHEEFQDPAAVVVNHIANKRIEYLERRRQQAEMEEDSPISA